MLPIEFKILVLTVSLFYSTHGEEQLETYCNVNGKKALQYVSEKFLSISIDPAVILAGLNLSETSLRLAQHLSPAYIRIAGPSTKFVKYIDNEDKFGDRLSEHGNNVVVTPSMWFGINEWLSLANLTPVFGINDVETARGVWNPKSTLPLLEISDKLNVSCYWQLGFDSSQKSELQYKQDLNLLSNLLAAFPERNESWKIIGSDISHIQQDHAEDVMMELQDITTAVMWEPRAVTEHTFPEKDMSWKILHQQHKPEVKIWTSVPKSEEPVSFSSTILWANQIGNAAKAGYDVVFRQPRLHEMFSDTPAYWFSLLHKKLMGSNVLDAKTSAHHPGSSVYAHCTRKQNSFVRRGALTVMVVNSNSENYKVKVKVGTSSTEKTMEVQSYILTSSGENSTDILLNGKRLTPELLLEKNPFQPKLRRAKSKTHVSVEVPPLSIGFFVLPGARVPACINEEKEINFLLEEIAEDQNVPFSEELVLRLGTRGSFVNNPTLEEIAQRMKQEMQSDERYYNTDQTLNFKLNEMKQRIEDDPVDNKVNQRGRKFFIDRAKLAERQKKHMDIERRKDELKNFLTERAKATESYKHETKIESKAKHLDLTSGEVEKILKERAVARAAQRNIIFTDEELDALMQKASKQYLKPKFKRSVPIENMQKRDINMHLLDRQIYSDPIPSKRFMGDHYEQFPGKNKFGKNKRRVRKPRDLNMKRLEYKAKLEDNRQRMEDKKYEILGNAENMKENIKDKVRKLKYKKRYRRDINMDLLKVKTDGQMMKPRKEAEKKQSRSMFKDNEEKEATIRKPGQTSDEFLEDLEERKQPVNAKPTNIEVFAELADPDEEDEEDDLSFFKTNTKPKNIFDKKNKGNFFDDESPIKEGRKRKQGKKKNSDDIQFLTASEEFTDIEEDLPCIHEYFGPRSVKNDNQNIVHELGEIQSPERKPTQGKSETRKMVELADIEEVSEERDSMDLFRNKRSVENSTEDYENEDDDYFDEKCKRKDAGNKHEITTNVLPDEEHQLAGDSKLEKLLSPENQIHKQEMIVLTESMLLDDNSFNHLSDIQEVNQATKNIKDGIPQLLRRSSRYEKMIKRNPINWSKYVSSYDEEEDDQEKETDEDEETMEDSELDTVEASEKDEEKMVYPAECSCSEKDKMSQLEIPRHKLDSLHDVESGKFRTTLRNPKNSISSRGNTIKDGPDYLRKKRDTKGKSKEELSDIIGDMNAYKEEVQHQLKELKQRVVKDKLKFEEERMQNKLKLLQITKEHKEDPTAKQRQDNLGEIHNVQNEKQDALFDQLELLKNKLEQRKMEIDKLLVKDLKLHERLEEEKRGMLKDILHEGKQTVKEAIEFKNMPRENTHEPVVEENVDVEQPTYKESSPAVQITKRSVINPDCDTFGNYKPLTRNLKTWKPSDILSLKRDVSFLKSQKLKPIREYRISKNNEYFNARRRRSIATSIQDIENEIDGFMNEIDKDSDIPPEMGAEDRDYLLSIAERENEGMFFQDKQEYNKLLNITDVNHATTERTNIKPNTTSDPTIFYMLNYDFGKEANGDVTTESMDRVTRTTDNIQKVFAKDEQQFFQTFMSNITGFFANIGKQLGLYMRQIYN